MSTALSDTRPEPATRPDTAPPPVPRGRLLAAAGGAVVLAARARLLLRGGGPAPEPAPTIRASGDVVELDTDAPQWSYLQLAVAEEQPALPPPPAPGRVVFDENRSAAAGSPLPGRVERVAVRLGDPVRAGDRLFAVRSGALADLDRDVESARSHVQATQRTVERTRALVALRAAPAKDQIDAEEDLRQAELALRAATAKRESLEAAIDDDTRFWVTSPRDGTVVELDVSAGQEVGPDHDGPLLRLSDLRQVLVLADLQERDAYDLAAGTPVTVRTPTGDVERPGVIEHVSQVVDPQRHTVQVRVRVDNADVVLRPNAFVEVTMPPDGTHRRVRVPDAAVVSDGRRAVIFVRRDAGRLERVPVTVGRRREGEVELIDGLTPGTRYVAQGALLLLNQLDLAQ
jgi:cobalt-zinc-cadmium efflux system membrane fusion protein